MTCVLGELVQADRSPCFSQNHSPGMSLPNIEGYRSGVKGTGRPPLKGWCLHPGPATYWLHGFDCLSEPQFPHLLNGCSNDTYLSLMGRCTKAI